eukprot:912643-Amorphochlora_amoeboformis.AAC.1
MVDMKERSSMCRYHWSTEAYSYIHTRLLEILYPILPGTTGGQNPTSRNFPKSRGYFEVGWF